MILLASGHLHSSGLRPLGRFTRMKQLEMLNSDVKEMAYADIVFSSQPFVEGGGSGSQMFEAHYQGSGPWAAKVFADADLHKKKKDLFREYVALKKAQGPNIVGVLGISFLYHEGKTIKAALLMEKPGGCALRALIAERDGWPLAGNAVSSIALGIATGMAHMHGLKVISRPKPKLKPSIV